MTRQATARPGQQLFLQPQNERLCSQRAQKITCRLFKEKSKKHFVQIAACSPWQAVHNLLLEDMGGTNINPAVQGQAINKKLTHKWSLFKTGVTTDNFTPKGSAIMTASVLLYAIIQVCIFCLPHSAVSVCGA